jgi:glycosyltransferase involved in cell wall biosynthesis
MLNMKLLRITTVPISLHKLLQGQPGYMQEHGFEVILASAEGPEIPQIETQTGLKVHTLDLTRQISPLTDLKALWQTYQLIKQTRPDIVHTHTPKAGLIGMLAAKLAGVPIRMHTVAGLPLMQASGMKRFVLNQVERLTSWAATGVYPNSKALAGFMIREKLAPSYKVKMIAHGSSNGIDTAYFNPDLFTVKDRQALKHQLGIGKEDFVFSFVGRLVGDKGINELVQAFISLQEAQPRLKLLLVGNEEPDLDPLLPETKQFITEHPAIITTGWVEDVRPYLAISDVFAFPSYREGMPNVVLQAGAMGLPQIVTDINGSNEIIVPKKNGLIIPVKDTKALYERMTLLYQDDALRTTLSQEARPMIQERFEQKVVWEALLKEYQSLLKAQGLLSP